MLNGEEGRQARELDDLIAWLKTEKPEMISLSNALLVGLARRLKTELGAPVICSLQGEDEYLDGLDAPYSAMAWETLSRRAADVDLFIAPSRYFGALMARRLKLAEDRVKVVSNGIDLEGFASVNRSNRAAGESPVIGYFGRMCRQKGLDVLVEAFILLRRGRTDVKLRVGGYCGPLDTAFVKGLRARLGSEGCLDRAEFHPNVSRGQKLEFFEGLSVFSTPATYSEAFGLYVIEAMAAGVPVAQPDHAAFPELIEATGGGVLCLPNDPISLASELGKLLDNPLRARALGEAGRKAVFERFGMDTMAIEIARVCEELLAAQRSISFPAEAMCANS
jgi:glycosyltransferase involved in cell wall biosynthesis